MQVSFTVRDSVRVIQVAILSCNCEVTQPRRSTKCSEREKQALLENYVTERLENRHIV